jgi:hypothetical protein
MVINFHHLVSQPLISFFFSFQFVLVGYSGFNGDLSRLTKGYDDCGNVCGKLNLDVPFKQCGVSELTNNLRVNVNKKIFLG